MCIGGCIRDSRLHAQKDRKMPSLAAVKETSDVEPINKAEPESPPPDAERGPTIFGIVAGGISGVIIGFFVAGSLFAAMAAATGVVVGLVMGWYAARLTEQA